jgi:hypothetical protein
MPEFHETLVAFQKLIADPLTTANDREAFWTALVTTTATDEAVAELRRLIEAFLCDDVTPPEDLDSPPLPRRLSGDDVTPPQDLDTPPHPRRLTGDDFDR